MVGAPPCACGAAPPLPKKIRQQQLDELTGHTKLKPAEVKALYARFRRLAPTGFLDQERFRQTMGVLGLTDDSFLPDRMFRVFDVDEDGKLSFFEFASSLAVMIRGSEDEKLRLSFEMTAGHRGAHGIALDDFQRLVSACNTMMTSLVTPSGGLATKEDTNRLFHQLATTQEDGEEPMITLEAYKEAVHSNVDFLHALGLEPTSERATASSKRSSTRKSVSRHAPAAAETRQAAAADVKFAEERPETLAGAAASQLEELRERVSALRRSAADRLENWKTRGARQAGNQQDATIEDFRPPRRVKEQAKPPANSWWASLDCCRVHTSESMEIMEDSCGASVASDRGAGMLEEVIGELDGILTSIPSRSQCEEDPNKDGVEPAISARTPRTKTNGNGHLTPLAEGMTPPARLLSPGSHSSGDGEAAPPEGNQVHPHTRPTSRRPTRDAQGGGHPNRKHRRHRLLGPKKGLAVHFGHENWNMVLSMMIGIRVSVGRVKHEVARELQPVDFIMKEKFSIIPRLANIFDSAVSKRVSVTRFVDYAPLVFQRIRAGFGIQHEEYLKSVGPEQLLGNMILGNLSSLSELSSEGKSGAFFYYTADGKYMMKTVSPKEHVLLKKMLHGYYQHIQQNPGTLICRFLGLHCLRIQKRQKTAGKSYRQSTQKLYFVVMGNMFNTPFDIHRRYDLKGSWVGRSTSPEEYDPSTALKDVDFTKASETINVGPDRRTEIVAQIERDSEFLRGHNIIDYSLLLGICELGSASSEESTRADARAETAMTHQPTFAASQEGDGDVDGAGNHVVYTSEHDKTDKARSSVPVHKRDRGGMLSSDKKYLYFIGIIDILTPYDNAKKAETFVKALYNDSKGVSCCPPAMYSDRFVGFMRRAFV